VFGFDEQSFGIPSGLFFASKYPINNPVFQPYNFQETPKNRAYGFFSAEIMDHETPIAKIITTHLQPNSTEEDLQYRHGQIQAIVKKSHNMIPTFVCGDLNIEKDSVEYKKELEPYFIDYYHDSNWTCCELRDFWWKANQNINQFQKFESPLETIDYFLQMKSSRFSPLEVETRIFPVNFLDNPQDSLSDHQMMISQIKFR
jgi:endonuclease/exonuclease/phosphatase family metal-dependent hydrolase